jgi:hypothetical protein
LGCTCPDEVFRDVRIDRSSLPVGRTQVTARLFIGGRLLIFLVRCSDTEVLARDLAPLVEAGRAARDTHGLNRFRLVLATPEPAVAQAVLAEPFSRAAGADPRLHLHVLDEGQLPKGLG